MHHLRLLPLVLLTFFAACENPDAVLFVTDTKIAIDGDSRPPNLTIGYGRNEVFIGPNFESRTGGIPPVVGRLESNLSILSPQISQVYATGRAATLVTSKNKDLTETASLNEGHEKRAAFFSTGSKLGLSVNFNESGPESVTFGYKQKEQSFIPFVEIKDKNNQSKEIYGSVLASIGVRTEVNSLPNTSVGLSQFFATGQAAEHLARDNASIRGEFRSTAQQAFEGTTATFVESPSGDSIDAWAQREDNYNMLKEWWEQRKPGVSVTLLTLGEEYEEDRKAAIEHFNIPELSGETDGTAEEGSEGQGG